jgi:hypothetical protein
MPRFLDDMGGKLHFWDNHPSEEAPPPEYVRCLLCSRLVEYDWIPFHSEDCDGIWWTDA